MKDEEILGDYYKYKLQKEKKMEYMKFKIY